MHQPSTKPTHLLTRLLAMWCLAILLVGPVAAKCSTEIKLDLGISSGVVPVVDFADTATHLVGLRMPVFHPLDVTTDGWIDVPGSKLPAFGVRGDSQLQIVSRRFSLFRLRTSLRL